jgi:tetratricopeptide (TPR) repeat protein
LQLKLFLPILLLCLPIQIEAQFDSIMMLPAADREWALHQFFSHKMHSLDSAAKMAMYREAEHYFEQQGADDLERNAWIHQYYYRAAHHPHDSISHTVFREAIEAADDRGWEDAKAVAIMNLGLYQSYHGQLKSGIENMWLGYTKYRTLANRKAVWVSQIIAQLGHQMYHFGDYALATEFFLTWDSIFQRWPEEVSYYMICNSLGLALQKSNRFEEAEVYFKKSAALATAGGDFGWAALARGNLGGVYFKQGKYDEAKPLLEEDFAMSKQNKLMESASYSAMSLAGVHLARNEPVIAESYLDFARRHLRRNDINMMNRWYVNMQRISRMKQDYRAAVFYADSARMTQDSISRLNDAMYVTNARQRADAERYAAAISLLENQRKYQTLLRNAIIVFLIMALVTFYFISRQRALKMRSRQQLAEMEKRNAVAELNHAREQLTIFTANIREKNELIERVTGEVEQLRQADHRFDDERTQYLGMLIESTILTEEEWGNFRRLFDKVYPGFFTRLRIKLPDLSPAETRLLALTKLQVSNREMASMLGVGYEAIRKTRQRLRRKLDLQEEGTLEEILEHVG